MSVPMEEIWTLLKLKPCSEAREAFRQKDAAQAWTACARGDWLLFAAARLEVDRTLVAMAYCDCVDWAIEWMPDRKPKFQSADYTSLTQAVVTARSWAHGEATIELVRDGAAKVMAERGAAVDRLRYDYGNDLYGDDPPTQAAAIYDFVGSLAAIDDVFKADLAVYAFATHFTHAHRHMTDAVLLARFAHIVRARISAGDIPVVALHDYLVADPPEVPSIADIAAETGNATMLDAESRELRDLAALAAAEEAEEAEGDEVVGALRWPDGSRLLVRLSGADEYTLEAP